MNKYNDLSEKLLEDSSTRESIRITLNIDTFLENGIPVEYKYNDDKDEKTPIIGIEKLEGTTMGIPGHFTHLGTHGERLIKDNTLNVLLFHCIKKQNEEIKELKKELEEIRNIIDPVQYT